MEKNLLFVDFFVTQQTTHTVMGAKFLPFVSASCKLQGGRRIFERRGPFLRMPEWSFWGKLDLGSILEIGTSNNRQNRGILRTACS